MRGALCPYVHKCCSANFSIEQPTFFLWEGTRMFLKEDERYSA